MATPTLSFDHKAVPVFPPRITCWINKIIAFYEKFINTKQHQISHELIEKSNFFVFFLCPGKESEITSRSDICLLMKNASYYLFTNFRMKMLSLPFKNGNLLIKQKKPPHIMRYLRSDTCLERWYEYFQISEWSELVFYFNNATNHLKNQKCPDPKPLIRDTWLKLTSGTLFFAHVMPVLFFRACITLFITVHCWEWSK